MDISFVILTWNSESYFEKCFDSLLACLKSEPFSYEIFIVDNGSKDSTVELLQKYEQQCPEFEVIYLPENVGTTRSRNLGLKKCCGDYVCIMDSDVEINEPVFQTLIETLQKNQNTGMVVPKIFYPSGKWQKSIDQFPTLIHKLKRFLFLRNIEDKEGQLSADADQEKTVDYAISAFWLFKKELLEKVGLLDENYFYAPEDVDYCLSTWKAGYEIIYQPKAEVIHHTQEISRVLKLNKAKKEHIKGLIYYFRKHGYFLRTPLLKNATSQKALFITYQFPPVAGPATQRHMRFISRLEEFSWTPVVLTVQPHRVAEYVMIDNELMTDTTKSVIQVRATVFNPIEVLLQIKQRFFKRTYSSTHSNRQIDRENFSQQGTEGKMQILKDFIVEFFRVPDMMNGWIPFAFLKGLFALRRYRCRVIYASGGPWSSLLVGYLLSCVTRNSLICDFRDPWIRNPYRKKKTPLIEKLETFLEKIVVNKAVFVIANTERLLLDFRKHYNYLSADKFVHISNGFDQRQFSSVPATRSEQNKELLLRHVGSLYGPRAPVALLKAISQLKKEGELSEFNFSLEFIGRVNADCLSQDSLKKLEIEGLVKMIPPVTHAEAIKAIQSSDALLIVQPDTALQIPGKLFEYIAACKPVIALACPGATADLVKFEKLGMVADADDIDEIKKMIIQLSKYKNNNTLSSMFGCENPGKFESRNLTHALTELFNQTININE